MPLYTAYIYKKSDLQGKKLIQMVFLLRSQKESIIISISSFLNKVSLNNILKYYRRKERFKSKNFQKKSFIIIKQKFCCKIEDDINVENSFLIH